MGHNVPLAEGFAIIATTTNIPGNCHLPGNLVTLLQPVHVQRTDEATVATRLVLAHGFSQVRWLAQSIVSHELLRASGGWRPLGTSLCISKCMI